MVSVLVQSEKAKLCNSCESPELEHVGTSSQWSNSDDVCVRTNLIGFVRLLRSSGRITTRVLEPEIAEYLKRAWLFK
jgi:hypothetical protein